MKKAFLHITAASLLSWIAVLCINVTLRAFLGSFEGKSVRNLMFAILLSAAFCVCLLYVEHIRNGKGEDIFFADYENEKYSSIKNDVKKIIPREKPYLLTFLLIAFVCFAVNLLYVHVLGNTRVFFLTMIYTPLFCWASVFPSSFGVAADILGYLISAVVIPFFYLIFLLIYRRSRNIKFNKGKH